MLSKLSIRARLRLYFIILFCFMLGLAASALLAVTAIEDTIEALTAELYPKTKMLGNIAHHLTEFRLDEAQLEHTNHDFAGKVQQSSKAGQSAVEHEKTIASLGTEFERFIDDSREANNWREFQKRWQLYLTEHRAWIANGIPAGYQDRAQALYMSAEEAIDTLEEADSSEVEEVGITSEFITEATIVALLVISVLALLFSGWVMRMLRIQVLRPLASITNALSSLAAGNREVQVPEVGRKDEIGEMANALEVFRRNAFDLEQAQRRAHELRDDMLTGLPNRRVFSEALDSAVDQAKFGTAASAVFLIDLDRFKPVNDSHGHPAGDLVLIAVSDRLRKVAGKSDTVARIGGDEFAIILEPERSVDRAIEKARLLAKHIIAAICVPISLGDNLVEIGCSIGIAICPTDGMNAEHLLRAADIAMYRAKHAGRGTACFFEQSMDTELRARAELEIEVRHAVARQQIYPHYQPLMDLKDGKLMGFEILARWHHPEKGIIMPDVFISIAEELGLIGDLTISILRRACIDARDWPENLILSLNVSPVQLKNHIFPPQLLVILNETGFSPRRLEIEITESALISDLETAKAVLRSIQSMGVKIALDDFGTGYSSLYHLRELSFDKVKIDRSFIQSMRDNPESVKIVNAILSLTKSLGLPATAEGLEDAEAVKHMIDTGCEFGQGYYFGKAMSPADTLGYVNENRGIKQAKAVGE